MRSEIQRPIGVPFGEQHQNVRAFGGVIGAVTPQHVGKLRARDLHAFRIVGADARTGRLQRRDDGERRGVAHVVGVGLEGHAEHADRLAGPPRRRARRRCVPAMARLRASLALTTAWTMPERRAGRTGRLKQRQRVLGETRAAIARPGMQDFGPMRLSSPIPLRHFLNVPPPPARRDRRSR